MSDAFQILSDELTEEILKQLALPDLLRASSTCRFFRGLISSPCFPCRPTPWLFLCGLNNISAKRHQAFGFDPSSFSWFRLPPPSVPLDDLSASQGLYFSTTSSSCFSYSPILRPQWTSIPPLFFPRRNPLIHVFSNNRILVVGGVRFIGGLVNIEEHLDVEIYNPYTRSWDLFPPLRLDFLFGYSSQSLSSALFRNKLFVLGTYSPVITWFDLRIKRWGPVKLFGLPIGGFSFLIACNDTLVVAAMCGRPYRFILWSVSDTLMELTEISAMPMELLEGLVDAEDDESKFACLKCVGCGNLIYVFNQEHYSGYSACIVDIASGLWRKLPPLPSPVNKSHKLISICSDVSHRDVILMTKVSR